MSSVYTGVTIYMYVVIYICLETYNVFKMFKVNSGARLSKLIQIIKRTCLDVTAVPKSNRKFAETETKS